MQVGRIKRYLKFTLLVGGIVVSSATAGPVYAEPTSNSSNYEASEMQFGTGSSDDSCSGTYCAKVTIGDTVGSAESSGTKATFGPITPDQPSLDVIVEAGESNLGTLTTESTGTKTMVVRVRSYLSNGYNLQITGDPPKYADHLLATPSSPTASDPGTEQFGLNVAANTAPNVGAIPKQVPDGTTSFGTATANYSQPNKFMYIDGDTIGSSATESGRTDYTISMIVNISNTTPAGDYTGDFSAVVIPAY